MTRHRPSPPSHSTSSAPAPARHIRDGARALWETEVGLDARTSAMGDKLDEAGSVVQDRFETASKEVIDAGEVPKALDAPSRGPHVAGHKENA